MPPFGNTPPEPELHPNDIPHTVGINMLSRKADLSQRPNSEFVERFQNGLSYGVDTQKV
jgi:hypothetical protein